jgi:N-acetyl-anhydromuramyl-L-alanine amidase AmpD
MWKWIKRLFGKKSETGPAPASLSLPFVSTTASTPSASKKTYDERRMFTPNQSSRPITPEAVILHHTSGSYNGSVSWCMNPNSQVSYHVIIARNGQRTVLADDTARCWHAGKSSWLGRPDLNSWSLGVAWEGDTYTTPLGEDAIASALEYLVPRMRKWNIPLTRVLTHAEVAPGRKNDVSIAAAETFEARLWQALKN